MSYLPLFTPQPKQGPSRRGFLVSGASSVALAALASCSLGASDKDLDLIGAWKVTKGAWGMVAKGSVVSFDGHHTALFSPQDTYALYKEDETWKLSITGLLGSGATFTVKVLDENNIELTTTDNVMLALKRVG